MNKNVSKQSKI